MHLDRDCWTHRLVKLPTTSFYYNSQVQRHIKWTTDNLHGLHWEGTSKNGNFLYYEEIKDFLKELVGSEEVVAVKGIRKKLWLSNFLNNTVIDLTEEGCPNLGTLKNIFRSFHCGQHLNNKLTCALENVNYLKCWYLYCKRDDKFK